MSSELDSELDDGQCLNFCWYADAVGAPVGYTCADELGCRKLIYEEVITENRRKQEKAEQEQIAVKFEGQTHYYSVLDEAMNYQPERKRTVLRGAWNRLRGRS